MANKTIKISDAGAQAILKSEGVAKEIQRRAKAIADAAGPGFEVSAMTGVKRTRAMVSATTQEARKAEAQDRALTRAIDAGRG